jgi:N-acetylgalactosamine-6-sulfatase
MNRRTFLHSAAAWPGILRASQTTGGGRPPNIVFILADDLGWGDLGCYGHRDIKTPNLDRMARQGALFTQFYVSAPVCGPSRVGFMTGNFPARHRIHDYFAAPAMNEKRGMASWLDPAVPFLPRLLKQAGYATAHFGKWGFGNGPDAPRADAYGIDVYRGAGAESGFNARDPYSRAKSTDAITGDAMRFLEQHRDQPCFVNVSLLLPHATLNPTEEQMKPYARFAPHGAPHKGALQIYYASVTDLDQGVGKLLAKLDELGLAGDTVVLFSSDNGPEDIHLSDASHSGVGSAGPFRGGKRSLYEGGIRMPFLVRWPKHVAAGRVDDTSVLTAVDFLPTICRLAGVPLPAGYQPDGEDVTDILLKQSRPRTKPILWEWRWDMIGGVLNRSPRLVIREGNWKLLMNPDRSRVELFDIPHDPSELNNLADRRPEVVKPLAEKLLAWQRSLPPGPVTPRAGSNAYPWPRQQ